MLDYHPTKREKKYSCSYCCFMLVEVHDSGLSVTLPTYLFVSLFICLFISTIMIEHCCDGLSFIWFFLTIFKEKWHPFGNSSSKGSWLEWSHGSCKENICGEWQLVTCTGVAVYMNFSTYTVNILLLAFMYLSANSLFGRTELCFQPEVHALCTEGGLYKCRSLYALRTYGTL